MATKNKKDKTKYQPRLNRGQPVAFTEKTAKKKKYTQAEVWTIGKNIPPVPEDLPEPQLSETALYIGKTRYAMRNDKSEPIESAREMFWRVAYNIACADLLYHGDRAKMIEQAKKFYSLMASQKFIPNTPTMLNAAKPMQQLSACFVLPIEDDMKSIGKTLVDMVMIHKSGGGCIAADARVWTTFCGIEPIETLFLRATADGRYGIEQGAGIAYDVSDLDIKTVSMNPVTGETGLKKVTQVWKYKVPVEKQIVITTAQGTIVQTSSWHPFMVIRGTEIVEVPAEQLQKGDIVLGPDKGDKYWPWKRQKKIGSLQLNPDLAWLVGFTLGDGSFGYAPALRQYRVRWFSGTEDVLKKVQQVLAKLNIQVSIQRDKRGLMIVSTLNQRFVHDLLEACGLEKFGPKADHIRVPEIISKSPLEVIKAFVAGLLDSDGYVAAGGSPSYSTVSGDMAGDLAALVSLLGFSPTLTSKKARGRGKLKVYSVQFCPLPQVNRLAAEIGQFLANTNRQQRLTSSSKKQTALPLNFRQFRDKLVAIGLVKKRSIKNGGPGPLADELNVWSSHHRIRRDHILMIADKAAALDKKLSELLRRIAVTGQEIRKIGKAATPKPYYDLSVEEWNTYAAGNSGMLMIHNTGFSFSRLRPYGDVIRSSGGTTVGPTSFLQAYNDVTSQIKQGGVRRGANMGIMHITHPDILRFAVMKVDEFNLTNFNISVTVTADWMDQVGKDQRFVSSEPDWEEVIGEIKSAQTIRDVDLKLKKTEDGVRKLYDLVKATQPDEGYDLINPRSQQTGGKLNAYKVFLLITQLAWHYGDPGMIMIDRINKSGANPTPHLGQIEATNPCVTGDTLISTGEGLIPMKEVVESHFAGGKRFGGNMSLIIDTRTLDHKTSGTLLGRAVKFFDNGIREVWRLTTQSGFTLTATPDHQLLTPKGWVKLQDLNIGDIVLIQSGRGEFGKNRQLAVISKIQTMPNDWSKELGHVLGWLIGDGWLRTGDKNCRVGFTFGKDDLDSLNYIQNLMNGWYGKDVKAVKRERNTTHLSYHSKELVDFFVNLGVKPVKAANKLVPESIYTAPVETVTGFLQGLFTADGTVNFKKGFNAYVRLTSKSKLLLQGVQLLLLNLGIYSKIYNRSRDSRTGMFPYKDKSGQLKTYTVDGVLFELSISKQSVMKFLSEVGFLSDRHQDKISKFAIQDCYADKFVDTVSEIKPFGRQRVYDLTEEKSLTFITNGIVSLDCGEQPLLPYDACTLGSINVGKFTTDGQIDYKTLGEVSQECVHFLDNVLDMNTYPIAEIAEMTRKIRRIGLGVMGLADLLVQMEIGYNTDKGLSLAEDVMAHVQKYAKEGSIKLAQVRGVFPAWKGSIFDDKSPHFLGEKLMIRNAAVTTIAPTGTIAMLADASSGIEPYFALSYAKNTIEGKRLFNTNHFFLEIAKREGFYSEELLDKIEQNGGSVDGLAEVPERWQKVFVVTRDITPEWHVKMQASFQKHVDNAISKTINFPNRATVEDVRHAYMMVYETGCRGITIYRDGSRQKQVLEVRKEGSYYDQLAGQSTTNGVSRNGHDKTIPVDGDMTIYQQIAKPLKAPGEAWGMRLKKKSDVGNVYTAVYRDPDGKPVEVFINVGKSGGYVAGAAEVTGRLASLALKHGAALEEVAAELVGIACGIPYGVGPNAILSMFDAAGKSILEAAKTKQLPLAIDNGEFEVGQHDGHTKDDQQESLLSAPEQVSVGYKTLFASCPDCGSQLILIEGCQKCSNPGCGYSKC